MRKGLSRDIGGLAATEYGAAGEGSTVVLLSSLALGRRSWQPTIEHIKSSAHCLAIDLPGQADSPAGKHFMTIPDLAEAVLRAVMDEGVTEVIVVGNSLGGVVAIEMARSAPELVASLIIIGVPFWPEEADRRDWLHSRSQTLLGENGLPNEVSESTITRIFGRYDQTWHRLLSEDTLKSGRALSYTLWALYSYDGAGALKGVGCPIVPLYGSNDYLGEQAIATLSHVRPDLMPTVISPGSHVLPLDRPDAVAASINGCIA